MEFLTNYDETKLKESKDFVKYPLKSLDKLEAASKSGARYVGMLASKKRIKADFEIIEAKGVSRQFMDSIHAPIGVDIGSVTPEEIALSIIAQIISVRRTHQTAS